MLSRIAGSCALFVLLATTAGAQVPAGGEFGVNSYTTGTQRDSSVAMQPDGGFVVVWSGAGAAPGLGVTG